MTLHLVRVIIGRGPIVRQLFPRRNVPHRHENDLALNGNVGFTGMIRVDHAAFTLVVVYRRDEQIFRDLDLGRT